MLSKKQKDVFDFIEKHFNDKGYSPSYEEIGDALGLSSKSTVFKHIKSLKERGFIMTIQGKKRAIYPIRFLNKNKTGKVIPLIRGANGFYDEGVENIDNINNISRIPLYGYIAAGYPIEAVQIEEFIDAPDSLVGSAGKSVFALKVKGDSMIEDMIMDGDIIILKKCSEVPNGKIVAAIVDGYEATLKRFYKIMDGKIKLMPSNPNYNPIILDSDKVKIIGELAGLIRKY
ncbi:MAG: transcriptional repressor LexA [Deltaproteobacteria bacterium]|jgi:repressor LexA|nr:transcriptional repressor LexA [Deltaproteobacteria bacterium]MCL5880817.1 transcriptional repressor LexA [Deltaproteobacteria bacterium]MDA8304283.1 transcriptional repressor LexA [Deltaproteobacteria bacterium]